MAAQRAENARRLTKLVPRLMASEVVGFLLFLALFGFVDHLPWPRAALVAAIGVGGITVAGALLVGSILGLALAFGARTDGERRRR